MRFKKNIFVIFVVVLVMLFVTFTSFIYSIKTYADETTWSIDWFGTELWRNSENKLQNEDVYYIQYYNSGWVLIGFSIAPSSVVKTSVNANWDKVTLTFDVPKNGYFSNNYVYSYGEIVYTGRSSTNKATYEVTCLKDTSYSSEKVVEEDTSFFGRLWQGLKKMWYDTTENTIDFLFKDNNVIDYWNGIGDSWCDFVKTTLGIADTDTDTLNVVLTDIYNSDYSSSYWANIDTTKIAQIQQTSNNLKQFWSNNVTVVNDDDDSYHYEIKNYNPVTNTYPDYLYDSNYFYENILYQNDTDLDDTNSLLQKIYNAIIDLPNKIKNNVTTNVTNTYNYLFVPDEEDLQDLFSDFIQTDSDGNVTYSNGLLACCTSLVDSVFSADDIYNCDVSTYSLDNTSSAPYWTMDFSFINQAFNDDFIENTSYVVIDFSVLDNYISTIRVILVSFSYLMFSWSIIKKEYNKDTVLS